MHRRRHDGHDHVQVAGRLDRTPRRRPQTRLGPRGQLLHVLDEPDPHDRVCQSLDRARGPRRGAHRHLEAHKRARAHLVRCREADFDVDVGQGLLVAGHFPDSCGGLAPRPHRLLVDAPGHRDHHLLHAHVQEREVLRVQTHDERRRFHLHRHGAGEDRRRDKDQDGFGGALPLSDVPGEDGEDDEEAAHPDTWWSQKDADDDGLSEARHVATQVARSMFAGIGRSCTFRFTHFRMGLS
mmetsp:Transcript_61733/g.200112  ORF Transcript_61733/g.200112 Transcript_61733/m.200112 type:complete len:239 (-) Transcript_61733:71-787(-)